MIANGKKPIIIEKIFQTTSGSHVQLRTRGNALFPFFKRFLLVLTKFSFWKKDWTLGYYSLKLKHFPDISQFPKIQSLKSFSNS